MDRLSIKIYRKNNGLAELAMKTDSKAMRIKNLKDPMDVMARIKQLGAALNSGAKLQAMFTLKDTGKGRWLLDCDARAEQIRVQLWVTDFIWYGTLEALKRAIRLL